MARYIGLDAHASSCTVAICTAAIVGPSGRHLASHVVETNARALISTIEAIPRQQRLCREEGALAGWLQEVLVPHIQEIVVTGAPKNRGSRRDKHDTSTLNDVCIRNRIESPPRTRGAQVAG